jgi:hypothetical protein
VGGIKELARVVPAEPGKPVRKEASGDDWSAVTSQAGWGLWAVLRRGPGVSDA